MEFIYTDLEQFSKALVDLNLHCDGLDQAIVILKTKLSYYGPERISNFIIRNALLLKPWAALESIDDSIKDQYEFLANKPWSSEYLNPSVKDAYNWVSLKSLHLKGVIQALYDYAQAKGIPTTEFPQIVNKISLLREQFQGSAIGEFSELKTDMLSSIEWEAMIASDNVNESLETARNIIDTQKIGDIGIKPGGAPLIENALNEAKHASIIAEQAKAKLEEIRKITGVTLDSMWKK